MASVVKKKDASHPAQRLLVKISQLKKIHPKKMKYENDAAFCRRFTVKFIIKKAQYFFPTKDERLLND